MQHDEPNLQNQADYPSLNYEQLSWKVNPTALKVWKSLGKFKYDDSPSECLTCHLGPMTQYLNQGYYLGQVNAISQLREGRGVWLSAALDEMYEGYWLEDRFSGKGRWIK
jgi:hypothetical protein